VPLRDRLDQLAERDVAVVVLNQSPNPVPGRVFATLITTLHAQRGARARVAVDAARAAGRVPGRRTLLTLRWRIGSNYSSARAQQCPPPRRRSGYRR